MDRQSRREFLAAAGAGLALAVTVRPAGANMPAMDEAIAKVVGGARITPGRVTLDLPPLSENGHTVPLTVTVDSPMTAADHVSSPPTSAPGRAGPWWRRASGWPTPSW